MNAAMLENFSNAKDLSIGAQERFAMYLENFLEPTFKANSDGENATITCPACGAHLMGSGIMDALLSSFQWGLAHGEGFCTDCRWPIRMYHFIRLDGEDKQRIIFPMAHRCYSDNDHKVEVDPANHKKCEP